MLKAVFFLLLFEGERRVKRFVDGMMWMNDFRMIWVIWIIWVIVVGGSGSLPNWKMDIFLWNVFQ